MDNPLHAGGEIRSSKMREIKFRAWDKELKNWADYAIAYDRLRGRAIYSMPIYRAKG